MKYKNLHTYLNLLCFILTGIMGLSQETPTGRVTDADTGAGLAFATLSCNTDPSVGVTTDIDGYYVWPKSSQCKMITASYLGYTSKSVAVGDAGSAEYNIQLSVAGVLMNEVQITAEKEKYDKSNPAVELIKDVISQRENNRPSNREYLEYDQYTAKSVALNNVTKESFKQGLFSRLDFLDQYIDTLADGNQILSLYLKEKVTHYTYAQGQKDKSKVINEQKTELDLRYFDQNIEQILDYLIQEVNAYDDKLFLVSKSFQNPISTAGLNMYRYYIKDTIATSTDTIIQLYTTTANKKDIGFTGDIYINAADRAIQKIDYKLDERAKLNFASDLTLQQQYKQVEGHWIPEQSALQALFTFMDIGDGVIGSSRVINTAFQLHRPTPVSKEVEMMSPSLSDPEQEEGEFWIKYRQMTDGNEAQVFEMIDSLNANPKFSVYKKVSEALVTGYLDLGLYEIGTLGSTYSFNPIEGSRLQFGGRSTNKLSKKIEFRGYMAYGLGDQRLKYRAGLLYSFNDDFDRNPVNAIRFTFGRDQYALGTELKTAYQRNILTSFIRGNNRLFVQSKYYQLTYDRDFDFNLRVIATAEYNSQSGRGDLSFNYSTEDDPPLLNRPINTAVLKTHLRWAPQEKYIQIQDKRTPIHSKYPIFELELEQAIPNIMAAETKYTRVELLIFKRMYASKYGYSDFLIEGGKFWGEGIPYHLLFIPRGNQTYFYKHRNFNMIDFFEYVTDSYVSINYRHYFDGFIMNRIPLINKFGLRSVVTMKALWGTLSDDNNPTLRKGIIQFPEGIGTEDFTLDETPYVEGSIGISNIFKVLRVDLLKRFTYLDSSSVPSLFGKRGLAVMFKFEMSF